MLETLCGSHVLGPRLAADEAHRTSLAAAVRALHSKLRVVEAQLLSATYGKDALEALQARTALGVQSSAQCSRGTASTGACTQTCTTSSSRAS